MTDAADAEPSKQPRRRRRWWQFSLRGLFLLVTLCGVVLYIKGELEWQRKKGLAERWAVVAIEHEAKLAAAERAYDPQNSNPLGCPEPLELPEQLDVLRIGMTSLAETSHRIACLKLLVELLPAESRNMLRRLATERNRSEVRARALQILALFRRPEDVDLVLPLLKDRAPEVRAAAADCLGIIHRPAFEIPLGTHPFRASRGVSVACDPPIRLRDLIRHINEVRGPPGSRGAAIDGFEIALPTSIRDAIQEMMLRGETSDERVAAARALVAWPPENYKLRVAEWGVWFDVDGELKLAQSVIDEIPSFVHRTFNSVESFGDRVNDFLIIDKPILHVTADQPLAIDVDVGIRAGRPWFAYPRPDQISVQVADVGHKASEPNLARFDRTDSGELQPLREGFPFLYPSFQTKGAIAGGGRSENKIVGLGLRWQSVIVSPEKLSWMAPPETGDENRHAWWNELRRVPSSWVSSQGETERFLYYDGPTLARRPLAFEYDGRVLSYHHREMFATPGGYDESDGNKLSLKVIREGRVNKLGRVGLLVRVRDDRVTIHRCDFGPKAGETIIADIAPIEGTAATDAFLRLLTDYGLTADEASGLFRAWEKQFFHTEGTRLITLLLPTDYEQLCPLAVRPQPTELVRLGLLLTEFGRDVDPAKN
jgi:hypothetical protein